jgi:hypothetical protein
VSTAYFQMTIILLKLSASVKSITGKAFIG